MVTVLLGCGIISAEDTPTFCWLFQTWLEYMDNVTPEGKIIDQDKAMQNAIQIVFPNTRHRWCLWHITRKFPDKLGSYNEGASIISHVSTLIYESRPSEFEECWKEMLDTYNLHKDEWLSGLYDERHRWIPCFVKSSYWAGVSTTQRSEDINVFFDDYVNSKTTLKQFVKQYGNALRNKVQKDTDADYRSITQMIPCVTHFKLEEKFQSIYTLKIQRILGRGKRQGILWLCFKERMCFGVGVDDTRKYDDWIRITKKSEIYCIDELEPRGV